MGLELQTGNAVIPVVAGYTAELWLRTVGQGNERPVALRMDTDEPVVAESDIEGRKSGAWGIAARPVVYMGMSRDESVCSLEECDAWGYTAEYGSHASSQQVPANGAVHGFAQQFVLAGRG